jgi:ribokinase
VILRDCAVGIERVRRGGDQQQQQNEPHAPVMLYESVRVAVVGHTEWVEFLRVERVPVAGEIVEAARTLEVAAGGGAVAAVQLARWGAESVFFTALGDDDLGRRAAEELRTRGVQIHAAIRAEPQRRAVTFVDAQRERSIVTIGERLVPHGADALPWDQLAACDAVYVTGGDAEAVRHARRARVVAGTARVLALFRGIQLDVLVGSAGDAAERYAPGDLDPTPRVVVRTDGGRGGEYLLPDGSRHGYPAVPAVVSGDTYGAGDTFAAALTMAFGEGRTPDEAVRFAAARAAEVVAFDGPYPP